ncbi:ATP-binding protein [Pseudomonas vancouverensis]|uniref:histidine kinase n=1 Tax=Pseudomonas vancouverensis TaxID=95300 RepID=A0A1H2NGA6_PSEVA|nr:ATP-binding protein [Pseudomonas vancouverensis]KAB0494309.1 HAMP domain-containing protein [Pseudomonas vancouverensis]TDB60617.1 HAMP domain-containing protein [Pseudomonas vancouverensis]SDV04221.1 two-component system, OmpR family, osmolarity sensor histidine kinase EnvZ [Pseudomonas vancouverensis]
MIGRLLPRDTLRRRIALTIVAAMVASLTLNALFVQVAGIWAQPPIERTGLLEQIASTTRVIEAAPASLRAQLASAASNPMLDVAWHAQRDQFNLPAGGAQLTADSAPVLRRLLGADREIDVFNPSDWPDNSTEARYVALVRMDDGSWLSFTPPERSWGLNLPARLAVVITLGLIATLLVAWIATRQLANPIQRFAGAARRFGGDLNAPPIHLEGPHEIRQAIIAFNTMQAQIQHFIGERTHMLASISHDLRAPLTRMRLRSEFMEDLDHQRKLIRDIEEMQSMINAALAFFREDTHLEQSTAFDLSELLQTIIDDFRDQDIAIDFSGPAHLVYIGRPLGIKRVIVNLLENAVKYGQHPRTALSVDQESVYIEVSDEGPGIPDAALQRVFDPFFRLETSRNRDTGGVGLGLSAARAIVREQGGELTLSNRKGLVARVELPRSA